MTGPPGPQARPGAVGGAQVPEGDRRGDVPRMLRRRPRQADLFTGRPDRYAGAKVAQEPRQHPHVDTETALLFGPVIHGGNILPPRHVLEAPRPDRLTERADLVTCDGCTEAMPPC